MKFISGACLLFCIYYIAEAVPVKDESRFCEEELKCIQELKLDKSYIESIITDDSSRFLPEDDDVFNTYLHCYWKARNFQNEKGILDFDNIMESIQFFPRKHFGGRPNDDSPIGVEIAAAAIEDCKHVPGGESHGQTAVKMQNCIDRRMMELVEKEK
ncbi:hypothetical protein PPYR_01158 [Photinus pyralis]|uniref:Uncharacterized protein n=1 Tax=Photinus pyralis TaxID=7054 RepID=A0A1Y1KZE4_PHOPY|nr:uncharacterized protein LOC116160375 [Photinus pyralis]KAB0804188.1 hypothetical protein PPYR_01158 [Photinus pyralis]